MLNTKYLTSIRSLRLSNQARKRNTHQNWRRSKMVTNCRSHNTILLLLSRLVVSNSVWPHRRQPTRLRRPWDSPGHFLLRCMKVKSESEVAQLCPTLWDPMDCSPPGSSVHGIFQARVLEWGALHFSEMVLHSWFNLFCDVVKDKHFDKYFNFREKPLKREC